MGIHWLRRKVTYLSILKLLISELLGIVDGNTLGSTEGNLLGEMDGTGIEPILGRTLDSPDGDSNSIGVGSAFGENDGTLLGEALVVVVGLVGKAEELG